MVLQGAYGPPPDDLVGRIKIYMSLKAPTSRNAKSFFNWIKNHKPLTAEESTFVQRKDDFVALSDGQEGGWLDGIVEDGLSWCLPLKVMKVKHCLSLSIPLNKRSNPQPAENLHIRRAVQDNRRRISQPVQ